MTDEELKALPKVRAEEASKYLKDIVPAISPQAVRAWAKNGTCSFCSAIKMKPSSTRHKYIINIAKLINYKHDNDTRSY